MFPRIKRSGKYEYLQLAETRREGGKVRQKVLLTIGRMDRLRKAGQIERLVGGLSRFSEKIAVLTEQGGAGETEAEGMRIGPGMIFGRIWKEEGIGQILKECADGRKYGFEMERAIFLTVLHRVCEPGSDRQGDKWRWGYKIPGTEGVELHHLYRAMAWLGEELSEEEQTGATRFSPRCTKDQIEEELFARKRDLFSGLELVFFDTTSIYFEGDGGETLGEYGHTKDYRADEKQMVVGVVLDERGNPICSEMWPGNVTDVESLVPVVKRLRDRFGIGRICIVADRGMVSKETVEYLEKEGGMEYILGMRMRRVTEVKEDVLGRAGRYQEVRAARTTGKQPAPLLVKEVRVKESRYIVCHNPEEAATDRMARESLLEHLEKQLKQGAKSLVGNKGYRKYLKVQGDSFRIDEKRVEEEARYDGKWVLRTNTGLSADAVALKYKELLLVENIFRTMKSIVETRPVYHKRDATIRGHVFCSFLAIKLLKELQRRLEDHGHRFEWNDIRRDLTELQEVQVESKGKKFIVRTTCKGTCGAIFQAVGVSLPPTIRMLQ